MKSKNVLGNELKLCGCDPMTGWYRNGYCDTDESDHGIHTVCAIVTKEFLHFSISKGNDLSTPMPDFGFKGLNPGDRWCLCAARWLEAFKAGFACPIDLDSTHEETLAIIPLDILKKYHIQ